MADNLRDLARRIAREFGIPESIFLRLIEVESGWNPRAVGRAGEIGLGQLMPATARALGVNPWDPVQNLRGAAKYLRQQYERFGDWGLSLAAYNAGPGAVQRGVIPESTRRYVRMIIGEEPQIARAPEKSRQPTQITLPDFPNIAARVQESSEETRPGVQRVAPPAPPVRPTAPRGVMFSTAPGMIRIGSEFIRAWGDLVSRATNAILSSVDYISSTMPGLSVRVGDREWRVTVFPFPWVTQEKIQTTPSRRIDISVSPGDAIRDTVKGLRSLAELVTMRPPVARRPGVPISEAEAAGYYLKFLDASGVFGVFQPLGAAEVLVESILTGKYVKYPGQGYSEFAQRAWNLSPSHAALVGLGLAIVLDPANLIPGATIKRAELVREAAGATRVEEIASTFSRIVTAPTEMHATLRLAELSSLAYGDVSKIQRGNMRIIEDVGRSLGDDLAQAQRLGRPFLREISALPKDITKIPSPYQEQVLLLTLREAERLMYSAYRNEAKKAGVPAREITKNVEANLVRGVPLSSDVIKSEVLDPLAKEYGNWVYSYQDVIITSTMESLHNRITGSPIHESVLASINDAPMYLARAAMDAYRLDPSSPYWYERWASIVYDLVGRMGFVPGTPEWNEAVVRTYMIYATLSQRATPTANEDKALRVIRAIQRLGPKFLVEATPEQVASAMKDQTGILDISQSVIKTLMEYKPDSPKITSFTIEGLKAFDRVHGTNLAERVFNAMKEANAPSPVIRIASTLDDVPPPMDVWMRKSLLLREKDIDKEEVLAAYRDVMRAASEITGLTPGQTQAAVWAWQKFLEEKFILWMRGSVPIIRGFTVERFGHRYIADLIHVTAEATGGATIESLRRIGGEPYLNALEAVVKEAERTGLLRTVLGRDPNISVIAGYWREALGASPEMNPAILFTMEASTPEEIQRAEEALSTLATAFNQQSIGYHRIVSSRGYDEIKDSRSFNAATFSIGRSVTPEEMKAFGDVLAAHVAPAAIQEIEERLRRVRGISPEDLESAIEGAKDVLVGLIQRTFLVPRPDGLRVITPLEEFTKGLESLPQELSRVVASIYHDVVRASARFVWGDEIGEAAQRVETGLVAADPERVPVEVREVVREVQKVQEEKMRELGAAPSILDRAEEAEILNAIVRGEAGAVGRRIRQLSREVSTLVRNGAHALVSMPDKTYENFSEWASRAAPDLWSALNEDSRMIIFHRAARRYMEMSKQSFVAPYLPPGEYAGRHPILPEEFVGQLQEIANNVGERLKSIIIEHRDILRGGRVSDQQIQETAHVFGMDPEIMKEFLGPRGAAFLAHPEYLESLKRAAGTALENLKSSLAKYVDLKMRGAPTDEIDRAANESFKWFTAHAYSTLLAMGAASEAGRSLRYYRNVRPYLGMTLEDIRHLAETNPDALMRVLRPLLGIKERDIGLSTIRGIIDNLTSNVQKGMPLEQAIILLRGGRSGIWDALTEWSMAAPLMGVGPLLNNIVATMLRLYMRGAELTIGGAIGRVLGTHQRAEEGIQYFGTLLIHSARAFPDLLRDILDAIRLREVGGASKYVEGSGGAYGGIIPRLIHRGAQLGFGLIKAGDNYVTEIAKAAETHLLAIRRVRAEQIFREWLKEASTDWEVNRLKAWLVSRAERIENLSPSLAHDIRKLLSQLEEGVDSATILQRANRIVPEKDFGVRVDEILLNKREILKEGAKVALNVTWNGPPAKTIQNIIQSIDNLPGPMKFGVRTVLRYIRTPANIFEDFTKNWLGSPIQLLKHAREGNLEQVSIDAARMLIAYGAFSAGWILGELGIVDGAGPVDQSLRQSWLANGHVPNSILIGDRRYRLSGLMPISLFLTIPATIREWIVESVHTGKPPDDRKIASMFSAMLRNIILDATFLQSLSNFYDAFLSRYTSPGLISQYISGVVGGMVPRFLPQLARAMDPFEREIFRPGTSMVEAVRRGIMYSIPGLREQLPAKLDPFGRPIESRGGLIELWVGVLTTRDDPVASEIYRLGLHVPAVRATRLIEGESVRVPGEQQRAAQVFRGQVLYRALSELVNNPQYQELQDDQKREAVRYVIRQIVEYTSPAVRAIIERGMTEDEVRRLLEESWR